MPLALQYNFPAEAKHIRGWLVCQSGKSRRQNQAAGMS